MVQWVRTRDRRADKGVGMERTEEARDQAHSTEACVLCGHGLFWVDVENVVVFRSDRPNSSAHRECCAAPRADDE